MNKLLLALSTASLLALTACGGGDPDDPPVQPTQSTNPSANNGGSTTGGSTTGGSTTGGSTTGGSTTGGSTTGGSTTGGSTTGGSTTGGSTTGGSTTGGSTTGGSTTGGSTTGGSTGGSTTTTAPKAYEPAQESRWNVPTQKDMDAGKPSTFKSASATGSRDNANKFNKVTINGSEMDIIPSGIYVGKTYSTDTSNYQMVIGGNNGQLGTAYARYGIVVDKNAMTGTVFYQGVPTSNMPQAGTATYKGNAIAFLPEQNKVAAGESSFNVNFAKKTITGTLSNWTENVKNVSISSTISGNTFKGSNNQGKFYGTNAQNLAGSFADKTQKIQGAFGANKQ